MKATPKPIDFTPVYGMHTYSRRYFKAMSRNYVDSNIAQLMLLYHTLVNCIVVGTLIEFIFY